MTQSGAENARVFALAAAPITAARGFSSASSGAVSLPLHNVRSIHRPRFRKLTAM